MGQRNSTTKTKRSIVVPTKRLRIAGILVTVSEPEHPKGVTFLLPGAMLSEASYMSTRKILHHQNQIVISFYINIFTKGHDEYANDVTRIHEAFCREYSQQQQQQQRQSPFQSQHFNIVGHSVGGKIALLCATNPLTTKQSQIETILALDPVDTHPPQFTNEKADASNRLLSKHHARELILTFAASTPKWAIPTAHNAEAIVAWSHQKEHKVLPLKVHKDADHMAYTDNGGGIMGWMMKGGTKEGNQAAREDVHDMIRKHIR